jgi:Icc-related predicted phosphoesterase
MRNKEFLVLADIHNDWAHLDRILELAQSTDGVVFLGDLIQQGEPNSDSLDNFLQIYEAAKWLVCVPGNGANPEILAFLNEIGVNIHGAAKIHDEIGFFGVGGVTDAVEVVLSLRNFFSKNRLAAIELDAKALETLNVFGVFVKDGFFEVADWPAEKVKEMEKYRSPFEHSENEVYETLVRAHESIRNLPFRVLLSHIPPYEEGLNPLLPEGVSTGSKAITQFIHEYSPTLVLSGHYHRNYRFSIESTPCAIMPAVKDGYYSLLHVKPLSAKFQLDVRRF